MQPIVKLMIAGAAMFATLGLIAGLSGMYNLNIKAKTVGHGQHGTARWATKGEIKKTYTHVRFEPELWRKGEHLPTEQGIVVGCLTKRHRVENALRAVRNVLVVKLLRKSHAIPKTADETTALVDTGDVHALMIGAAGGQDGLLAVSMPGIRPGQQDVFSHQRYEGGPPAELRQYRQKLLWISSCRH